MSSNEAPANDLAGALMTVDIVSDVVCPWCYIGKRRLEAALTDWRGPAAQIRWHPFQLNPDIPAGGVDRRSYLERKFGGPERAQAIYTRVQAAGREVGIPFEFEKIARQPNTGEAHRLIAWVQAAAPERADQVVERLFQAYFTEGVDIGSVDELVRLAAEAGCEADDARAQLESDRGRDEVAAADQRARALGISGVPFFIFNRRIAVSGAQPPELLRDAMAQAEAAT